MMELIEKKSRECLDELSSSLKVSLELKKKVTKETFLREQLAEKLKSLEDNSQFSSSSTDKKSEITRLLEISESVLSVRREKEMRQELNEKFEQVRFELQTQIEENERLKEKYRESLVSSTRFSLQMSQLSEEVEAAQQNAAKAERNAIREARKGSVLLEERNNISKRCEQLEKQLNHLRAQQQQQNERAASASASSSHQPHTFRVKAVEDGKTIMKTTKKKRTNTTGPSSNKKERGGELSEFDFT